MFHERRRLSHEARVLSVPLLRALTSVGCACPSPLPRSTHLRTHRSVVVVLTLMPYGENGDRALVFNLKERNIARIAERDDELP